MKTPQILRLLQKPRSWTRPRSPFRPLRQNVASASGAQLLSTLKYNLSFHASSSIADAAVLIAITNEADPKILFTKRASHMTNHAGEVSFPGGKREPADTSNASVAIRETLEEVGIDPSSVELLGELPSLKSKSGLRVKPIVGLIPADVTLTLDAAEVDVAFFVPIAFFIKNQPQPYAVRFNDKDVQVPAYFFDDHVIWGLTGRLVSRFLKFGFGIYVPWPWLYARRSLSLLKLRRPLLRKR